MTVAPHTAGDRRTLYVAAISLASFLLFSLELLAGRLVLPVFGGSPGVWTTALCFFTASLFLAYLYAHLVATRLRPRVGATMHLCLAIVVAVVTLAGPTDPAGLRVSGMPTVVNVILSLALIAGPAALLLGSTSPLLSAWFATGGRDPWWLYAASNAASLLALLAYPIVIQPAIPLSAQRVLLLLGLLLFVGLLAVLVVRRDGAGRVVDEPETIAPPVRALGRRRQLTWLLCAAIPAGLLSAVTALITTDLISAPLLWVGPLAIYLGSFVVAFSARGRRVLGVVEWLVPAAVTLLWVPYVYPDGRWPIVGLLVVLFGSYAVVATAIHGRLAADRPDERYLTRFYLILAAGGMLATGAVAIVAPLAFSNIYEYPLLVVAGAASLALLPGPGGVARKGLVTVGLDAGRRLAPYAAIVGLFALQMWSSDSFDRVPVRGLLLGGAVVAIAARSVVLATGTAVALIVLALAPATAPLYQERTFFGVLEVRGTPAGDAYIEYSGTTLHGAQMLGELRREPTSYYVEAGPIGDVFDDLRARTSVASIGVVGLGVGTIAAYAGPRDALTFYEIDQATVDIANDARFFSYLSDAAVQPHVTVGDARLSLEVEPPRIYDVLVLDAFSSDAVPAHLLTKEAMATYMRTLRPGGVIAFHLSNRYYELPPGCRVDGSIAGAGRRRTGLRAWHRRRGAPSGVVLLGRGLCRCRRVHRPGLDVTARRACPHRRLLRPAPVAQARSLTGPTDGPRSFLSRRRRPAAILRPCPIVSRHPARRSCASTRSASATARSGPGWPDRPTRPTAGG